VSDLTGEPGTILSLKPFVIACGEKSVELIEIQPQGKKRMTAQAFLAGHKLNIGDKL
jgi:methionyl-tRNA formyltransferase